MSVLLTARPPTARQERLFGDDPGTGSWGAAAPVPASPSVDRERSSGGAVADAPAGGIADERAGAVADTPARGTADARAGAVADAPAEAIAAEPAAVAESPATAAEISRPPATAGPTLAAAVTSLWDRLTRAEPAACPVCDAPMEPRHSAGAGVVGGRCRSCGSTLA